MDLLLRTKKQKVRFSKIIFISSLIIFLFVFLTILGISIFVGLNVTAKDRKFITENPSYYSLPYQKMDFLSRDGKTKLKGWIIEPEQPKMTIIFSHGYGGNKQEAKVGFLRLSKILYNEGYRVIMFDFRASGESEGERITVGANEKLDLLGVIDYAKQNYQEKIVLYGVSMGAATSLLAAGDDSEVLGVIADSPFSDLRSYLEDNMSIWTNLPDFPFTPVILATIPVIASVDIGDASPMNAIEQINPRPILFIHGDSDRSIPYNESKKLFDITVNADIWFPEGTDHIMGFRDYPEEYSKRVLEFLKNF